jgi:crotonobetainyl-CoA:carnitine CoA-transferase CaiB-like acyl-CoA transferase
MTDKDLERGDQESPSSAPPGYDVLEGIRVIEVSAYGFAPAAGAILAEWGADVIRIVHPIVADPHTRNPVGGMDESQTQVAYMWEIVNRGKQTLGVDLKNVNAREVFEALIQDADVFLTSLLPTARKRLHIDVEDVRGINPTIIYARASANGPAGEERDAGGFDVNNFWARTGLGYTAGRLSGEQGQPAMAMGDLTSAMGLAGGITGACSLPRRPD